MIMPPIPTAPYSGRGFCLSFPEPMAAQDRTNFVQSLSPYAMLWWGASGADEGTLRFLGQQRRTYHGQEQRVGIVLRMDPAMLLHSTDLLLMQLDRQITLSNKAIVGVVVGNEHEPPQPGLRWHLPNGEPVQDWGNRPRTPLRTDSLANITAVHVRRIAPVLRTRGIAVVAPGYSMHGYTEDDAPDPGLFSWREVTIGMTNSMDAADVHYYDTDWWVRDPEPPDAANINNPEAWREYANRLVGARTATQANVHRFMQAVRFWSGFYHVPIWWGEANTKNRRMGQMQHMEACVGKSKLLSGHRNPEGYLLGERVALFCPFTSNGLGNAYPAEYIMRDPRCYTEIVRPHLVAEGFEP